VAVALSGLTLAVGARPAAAHVAQSGVEATLDSPAAPTPGMTVRVDHSLVDRVVVTVRSGPVVVIDGPDGQPFLRVGPTGVEARLDSVGWLTAERVDLPGRLRPFAGPVPVLSAAPPGPGWVQVTDDPSWGWPDPRLRPTDAAGTAIDHGRWRIGATVGARSTALSGHLRRVAITGEWESSVDPPTVAATPGLAVATVDARAPSLVASYDGPGEVVVLGAGGEGLVRFGAEGVEVNVASPTWAVTSTQAGVAPVPPIGATVAARWQAAGPGARPFQWIEPRLDYPVRAPGGALPTPVVVGRWTVPILVDGAPAVLSGTIAWQSYGPTSGTGVLSAPLTQGVVVALAAVVLGVAVVWRRRRAGS